MATARHAFAPLQGMLSLADPKTEERAKAFYNTVSRRTKPGTGHELHVEVAGNHTGIAAGACRARTA